MKEPEQFDALVLEVYSGDDVIVMVDLGVESLHKKVRFRLQGVDTPNGIGAPKSSEAGKLRSYVQQLCRNQKVRITVTKRDRNHWLGILEIERGGTRLNVNEDLIRQGYKFTQERGNNGVPSN